MATRTLKSIRNSNTAFVGQLVILIAQFITQTVFVKVLGSEYLGANGLFTNILTLLSFADLGIGGAITYALYKPLAENDYNTISAIMELFKKIYNIIGCTIFVLGTFFSFFIEDFINSNTTIPHIQIMFILFVLNSATSYFYAYLRSLLIADQQGYIDVINRVIFTTIQTVLQISFLLFFHKYVLFLIIQILCTLSANISLYRKTLKAFPYLYTEKSKNIKISPKIIEKINKNVVGAVASRLGIVVANGTDNLILSSFIGLSIVGKYTSYMLIFNSAQNIVNQAINSVISSIANFSVEREGKGESTLFFNFQYVVFGIAYVCSSVILVIVSNFITLWIGKFYVLGNITTILIIVVWFINISRLSVQAFITAHGLYWETKWKSIIEAIINLIASLCLIKFTSLGVNSVILGTLISIVFVSLWWEPMVLFTSVKNISLLKFLFKYLSLIFIESNTILFILYMKNKFAFLQTTSIVDITLQAICSGIIFTLFYLAVNIFSTEQRNVISKLCKSLKKRKQHVHKN